MSEIADKELTFKDYVAVFKRRGNLFFWITAPVLTLGIAVAFGLPAVYESYAILLAEQQEVPEYLVRSAIPDYADQRVRMISQRVMTRENLNRIIVENDLYPELRQDPDANPLGELRSNLRLGAVEPIVLQELIGNSENAVAFTVTFEHSEPETAYNVASELVSLYLNENQRAREELTTETVEFLAREVERLELELGEREGQLAEFKGRWADSLPELSNMNLSMLDRTETDLDNLAREIRMLGERRTLLESELSQLSPYSVVYGADGAAVLSSQDRLKVLQREFVQMSAVYSQDHPDVLKTKREIEVLSAQTGLPGIDSSTLQVELAARTAELAAQREVYSETHPDVLRLERTVANLRDALQNTPEGPTGPVVVAPPDNPLYIQKQVQLEGTRTELNAAYARRAELRNRLSDLEARLTRAPEVEREYAGLTRGYEQLRLRYDEALNKQREAEIALNLEAESKGERFNVLDSPDLPVLPVRPNRIALILLTIVLAFAAGAGSVAVAEVSDSTVRNARDVSGLLEIPPLVVIPFINNEADVRSIRMRKMMFAATVFLWLGVTIFFIFSPAG